MIFPDAAYALGMKTIGHGGGGTCGTAVGKCKRWLGVGVRGRVLSKACSPHYQKPIEPKKLLPAFEVRHFLTCR